MSKLRQMLMLASVAFVMPACAADPGRPDNGYESFENGVPGFFSATRPESLGISPWHYRHGTNSLRWDWVKGDELVIRRGIGDPARAGGFLSRAAFAVCVYMEKPVSDALVFSFRQGDTITGSFRFPLEFTGWRQARIHYDRFTDGRPTAAVDNIRISAAGAAPRGTVFLDSIRYNSLTYYSAGSIIPEAARKRKRLAPDERRFPKPLRVTAAELAGIEKLFGGPRAERPGITEEKVASLCEQVKALGVVRDDHGVRGPGLGWTGFYYAAPGEFGEKDVRAWPDELGPNGPEMRMQSPGPVNSLAGSVAGAFRASTNDSQRARLEEAFFLLADYLLDQGHALELEPVIRMRESLAKTGRLQLHMDGLFLASMGDRFFVEGDDFVDSNMDFYASTGGYRLRRMLHLCFLQVEPAEQVRWLNAWKAMLERSILQPASPFKIDGSAYHHRGHYHSYAQNAFVALPKLFQELSDTPWRVSGEAHDRFRRAVMAQRFYCNKLDKPISLFGRSPFASERIYYGIFPSYGDLAFDTLARLGTTDGRQGVDPEVAAAYLRLAPEAVTNEPYRSLGIAPEPDPNGTFVMPYAALLCHRRDNWLASIKGQSKYCWGSERQAQRNCYGLFQGLGNLEILAGGNPVTARASGRDGQGWDWRRFEGTTAPQLPLKKLDSGWHSKSAVTFSSETFVGGLSHQGRQGVFAMIVNETIMPEKHALRGRKSWFFNDDQIVCLGSDIACAETEYPTHTTLCQKALTPDGPGKFLPTLLDGTRFSAFPWAQALDKSEPHWFLDVQQTGYYLPPGQNAAMARQHQVSRDVNDWHATEGNFLTAWIDHGKAPWGAGYEYMLVVRATPEAMRRIVAEPPYRVLQRDQAAHIVRHSASGRWGGAFFAAQAVAPPAAGAEALPVKAVDRPCLIMAAAVRDGRLALSAADPDLNLESGVSRARPLRITLRGRWRLLKATGTVCAWPLPEAPGNVRIVSADAADTILEIACRHGASYDISLVR